MAFFTIYTDAKGRFRWQLTAVSGEVIATSTVAYLDRSDCEDAIRVVKSQAPYAQIVA